MIPAAWRTRWAALPGNRRAILWATINAFSFSFSSVCIKAAGSNLPIIEIVFISTAGQLLYLTPRTARDTMAVLRGRNFVLHMTRILVLLATMLTGYAAVVYLPVANSTSISFAKPMFTTLLAVLILHEIVVWQRWGLTAIGFLGVLMLARPDVGGFDWISVAAIASALLAALGAIMTRILAQGDRPATLIVVQAVVTMGLLAPFTYLQWVTPTAWEWFMLFLMGASGAGGGWAQILAYREGDASVVAPLDYTRLLFSAVLGFLAFAEIPTPWTLLGIAIIVGSQLLAMRYERR